MYKFLLVAMAAVALTLFVPTVQAAEPTVQVELRRAEYESAPGLTEAKVMGTEKTIYLHASPDLTNDDIASACFVEVLDNGVGRPTVEVTFTEQGQQKMAKLSKAHLQKPLAILVDGQVVAAPVIRSELGKTVQITGTFSKAEAVKIADGLNGKSSK
jgi:preprotein translocase subunit SecD